MIKRVDRLILITLLRPFLLVYSSVTFVLIMQFMLRHFEDFVGKGLSILIFLELYFYFAASVAPTSLPLSVLLTSLICYGNLGEHSEFTALKAGGISASRLFLPGLIFSSTLGLAQYALNSYYIPHVNKKSFTLLHDIRTKKASLQLIPGQFFTQLPNHAIRVEERVSDENFKNILIYHRADESSRLIRADSARIRNILDEFFLVIELYDGQAYEEASYFHRNEEKNNFVHTQFDYMRMQLNLSALQLNRSATKIFAHHRYMKTTPELYQSIDSLESQIQQKTREAYTQSETLYTYHRPHTKKKSVPTQANPPPPFWKKKPPTTKT
ncbi:MAG: LptF/LptG family permease, partial [Cytophagales bacterium]|nr:LptF/LptG family permease [Cytophagales bacterium]